jgi:hypothetical protein
MPIFSEIEEGQADKKYNSPEIDDKSKNLLRLRITSKKTEIV